MSVDMKVPEIRFEGFSGEWVQSNLAECTDLLTGNPFNSKKFIADGIFLVRGMNVKRGYLDTSSNLSEYWSSSKGLERYLLEPEDIVIQMDGALIGKSYAKINSNNLPAILVQRVTRVRCNKVEADLIYQYIQKDFLKHISGIKTETAVPHLSLHDIRNFQVFLPEEKEQIQIGNTFQKLDSLINQHQQKHEKLSSIKKAMLEKMFPKPGETVPQIRFKGFSGEWEESSLFEETIVSTGFPFDSSDFCGSGNLLVITNGNIQNSSSAVNGKVGNRIPNEKVDLLNQYALNIGDILVTMDGSVGRTAKVIEPNQILAQRVGRLVAKNNTEFLYQSLNTGAFLDGMTTISHGGTIKHISLSEIGSYRLLVPDNLEEQEKIGNYLKKLDTLINQHQQQITKLTHIKQACLSKMFV